MEEINNNKSTNLENIKESEEEILYDSSPLEEIKNLRKNIILLESKNSSLQKKIKELTKENLRNDTKLKRISFIGVRKNYSFDKADNYQFTHLIKEKNDLQEINEKM